jgi:hypothetical protein
MRFDRLPEYGIMEWWNTGKLVFKRILSILILSSTQILSLTQHCIIPKPIIAAFQLGRSPLLGRFYNPVII